MAPDLQEAADRGEALPDGTMPTRDDAELEAAFGAYQQAGRDGPIEDRAKLRRYLVRRAVALGRTDLVPDDWRLVPGQEATDGRPTGQPASTGQPPAGTGTGQGTPADHR